MLDLRTQYVTAFEALPHVALAAPHDGEFGPDEVTRLGGLRTPAVYVACMGGQEHEDGGPSSSMLRWVAMVLARPPDAVREGEKSAGDVAALIALRIVHELSESSFPASLERATGVRSRNLFGADGARKGYRLWAVTWMAPTRIRPADLDPMLDPFRLLVTEYDLGPADGTIDTTTNTDLP